MSGGCAVPRNRTEYTVNDRVYHSIGPREGVGRAGVYASGGLIWQISFAPLLPPYQITLSDLFDGADAIGGTVCGNAHGNRGAAGANKLKARQTARRVPRNAGGKRAQADGAAAADGEPDEPEEWL